MLPRMPSNATFIESKYPPKGWEWIMQQCVNMYWVWKINFFVLGIKTKLFFPLTSAEKNHQFKTSFYLKSKLMPGHLITTALRPQLRPWRGHLPPRQPPLQENCSQGSQLLSKASHLVPALFDHACKQSYNHHHHHHHYHHHLYHLPQIIIIIGLCNTSTHHYLLLFLSSSSSSSWPFLRVRWWLSTANIFPLRGCLIISSVAWL